MERSLAGAALGAGIMGFLCFLGGMGMGDLKLCLAVGAWIGPSQLVMALVVMGVAGGVMALLWAMLGGFLRESLDAAGDLVVGWAKPRIWAGQQADAEQSGRPEHTLRSGDCDRHDLFVLGAFIRDMRTMIPSPVVWRQAKRNVL